MEILVLDAERIEALISMSSLIDRLREAFRTDLYTPPRRVLDVPGGTGGRSLLEMPAFSFDGSGAVKLTTLYPGNPAVGLPTIQGVIVVFNELGTPVALLDGGAITRLRTAAASGLASTYLSMPTSRRLALAGTGALAPDLAAAHCLVRPIEDIRVYGRRAERVATTVDSIRAKVPPGIEISAADDWPQAVSQADIVSCATRATEPILLGDWLRPGTFVDLVGGYKPQMREADDEAVLRSRVFVDTFEGALSEAGDLIQPLSAGTIARDKIEAEMVDLVCGRVEGRRNEYEVTLFKSVGTAIEDLAASRLVVELTDRQISGG